MRTGKFITVEGSDGAGKSTQIDFMKHWLTERDIPVIQTREPGGTEVGELIRSILLNEREANFSDGTELLLVFAARMQHLDERIRPALREGCWVVCDRFTDATYAYQGGGRGIEEERIAVLERWVQKGLQPDLTLFLDVPVEVSLNRARLRGALPDRFERESAGFKEAVRTAYRNRALADPGRIRLVDAGRPVEMVRQEIEKILAGLIEV
ncbi:MAG: dTMP kinase [Gammaproteobacteria bacterium]|nr:dTMP kinase [Gammaproteobacteria bacterium]